MHKVLITTIVLANLNPRWQADNATACHALVAEFDTEAEALAACQAVGRRGGYPMHATYAVPLFDASGGAPARRPFDPGRV
jgi:hypothetical protein